MGCESLVGAMVFVVLLTTSQLQDGRAGNGSVSDEEPAGDSATADFLVSPQGNDGWSGR